MRLLARRLKVIFDKSWVIISSAAISGDTHLVAGQTLMEAIVQDHLIDATFVTGFHHTNSVFVTRKFYAKYLIYTGVYLIGDAHIDW